MKLFVDGRKETFKIIKSEFIDGDTSIWFHAASLGEYEQAVPIIEMVKRNYPNYKIVISFFSPSGYEIKKNSPLADVVVYLPLDTPFNARQFIYEIRPKFAFFIKYEFWPNYLKILDKNNIPTFLISGVFRKEQPFFKFYGKWMRDSLKTFNHFFLQNKESKHIIENIGFKNTTVSGDTRYDRVTKQLEMDNSLSFIENFIDNQLCFVAGSTWSEDENILVDFINNSKSTIKFIIAPHVIDKDKIEKLKLKIKKPVALYSQKDFTNLKKEQVLILDTIGILSKVYSYANFAYVGGGMGTNGLHNILEPATFGIPIITGKNIEKFPEALELKKHKGLFTVNTKEEFQNIAHELVSNDSLRINTGTINKEFIKNNTGATQIIENYLLEKFHNK